MSRGKIVTGAVIDARDLTPELEEWCIDNDISTHYEHSLNMFHEYEDEPLEDNPLVKFVLGKGIDRDVFIHDGVAYVSVIGT